MASAGEGQIIAEDLPVVGGILGDPMLELNHHPGVGFENRFNFRHSGCHAALVHKRQIGWRGNSVVALLRARYGDAAGIALAETRSPPAAGQLFANLIFPEAGKMQ